MTIFNVLTGKYIFEQSLDFLLVGGGGSSSQNGGSTLASGGGAGGVYDLRGIGGFRSGNPYVVVVGAGGLLPNFGSVPSNRSGNSGGHSRFGDYYVGGGNTGAYGYGGAAGATGTSSPGTGNAGGSTDTAIAKGYISPSVNSGGGGGAGTTANNYYTTTDFRGTTIRVMDPGNGAVSNITGTDTYYGGGGGNIAGGAGSGGGGSGFIGGSGTNGLGGGGGAIDYFWNGGTGGGNGGDGLVIVRQLLTYPLAVTTGSPTITTSGSYRLYQWSTPGTYSMIL